MNDCHASNKHKITYWPQTSSVTASICVFTPLLRVKSPKNAISINYITLMQISQWSQLTFTSWLDCSMHTVGVIHHWLTSRWPPWMPHPHTAAVGVTQYLRQESISQRWVVAVVQRGHPAASVPQHSESSCALGWIDATAGYSFLITLVCVWASSLQRMWGTKRSSPRQFTTSVERGQTQERTLRGLSPHPPPPTPGEHHIKDQSLSRGENWFTCIH